MSDIAGYLAEAIEHDVGEAVRLQGTSTGGSVALQLAIDHPDLVRRLVVVASAYRLGARELATGQGLPIISKSLPEGFIVSERGLKP